MDLGRLRCHPGLRLARGRDVALDRDVCDRDVGPRGQASGKEGDYAYEFMAIEEGEVRTASVVATTPMRLVTLSQWDLTRVGGAIDEICATLEQRQARGAQGT